jgi:hypothetical protein
VGRHLRDVRNPQTDWLERKLCQQRSGLADLILCTVWQGFRDERQAKNLHLEV